MARNVLVLHTDQQRYDSMGCTGNPFARTPSLDRLAAEGTLFTRHIVSSPICSPSRASLLTGLYPPGHGLWCNGVPLNRREYAEVNPDDHYHDRGSAGGLGHYVFEPPTLADLLGAAGYQTAAFGKLHLTPNNPPLSRPTPESWTHWRLGRYRDWRGPYYGFEHYETALGHGQHATWGHYRDWLEREHPEMYRRSLEPERQVRAFPTQPDLFATEIPLTLHHSSWLAERFGSWLSARRTEQPFFAFVGFSDPHHPFNPCREVLDGFPDNPGDDPVDPRGEALAGPPREMVSWFDPSRSLDLVRAIRRSTHALVHQVDRAVGRILGMLERDGSLGETIVVFTSDHGDFLGDHGSIYKSIGVHHCLVHTPLILRIPGASLPRRFEGTVSNVDVLPTVLAAAGVDSPPWRHGRDLAQPSAESVAAMAFSFNGDPRYVGWTVYDDRYRMSLYPNADWVELYDHREDPGECRNVAASRLEVVRAMRATLGGRLPGLVNPAGGRMCSW